ncbi:peptidase M50 family protein, partial [Chlamydia psittaci C1/97]
VTIGNSQYVFLDY